LTGPVTAALRDAEQLAPALLMVSALWAAVRIADLSVHVWRLEGRRDRPRRRREVCAQGLRLSGPVAARG